MVVAPVAMGNPAPAVIPAVSSTTSLTPSVAESNAENGGGMSHNVDIATWAANTLQSFNLKIGAKGTGVPLSIPIDDVFKKKKKKESAAERLIIPQDPAVKCRDRREDLFEGREGTRQRRRWENDHFKNVPNAQPPQPSDWTIQPTHPVVHVPYHLAKYWDDIAASRVAEAEKSKGDSKKMDQNVGRIPRDVRDAAKRNPVFKAWVRSAEEPIRWFATTQKTHAITTVTSNAASASISSSIADITGDVTPRAHSPSSAVLITPSSTNKTEELSDLEIISPICEVGELDFATDTSDGEDILVFQGRGRTRTHESLSSMVDSMSLSQSFHHVHQYLSQYPQQRKSVLALQRDEDWEELLPVGTKSRTSSSRNDSVSLGMWDVASWRVVPGRAGSSSPAAMLFTPDYDMNSAYKRWIVHFVALYYGLESTSINDGDGQRRYVFVGPKSASGKTPSGTATMPGPMWEHL